MTVVASNGEATSCWIRRRVPTADPRMNLLSALSLVQTPITDLLVIISVDNEYISTTLCKWCEKRTMTRLIEIMLMSYFCLVRGADEIVGDTETVIRSNGVGPTDGSKICDL